MIIVSLNKSVYFFEERTFTKFNDSTRVIHFGADWLLLIQVLILVRGSENVFFKLTKIKQEIYIKIRVKFKIVFDSGNQDSDHKYE